MTDAIDEARAKVHDKLVSVVLATVIYGGKSEEVLSAHAAVMAAADRLALAYLDAAAAECVNCQDTDPEEREELTQRTGHGWCDAHRALRARLEGSHAD